LQDYNIYDQGVSVDGDRGVEGALIPWMEKLFRHKIQLKVEGRITWKSRLLGMK